MGNNKKGGLMKQMRIENEALRKKYQEAVREIKFQHEWSAKAIKEANDRAAGAMSVCNTLLAHAAVSYGTKTDNGWEMALNGKADDPGEVVIASDKDSGMVYVRVTEKSDG